MEIADIIPHVEALIFASDHPLPAMEIVELLNQSQGFLEDQVLLEQVTVALEAICEKYDAEFYAFEIKQSGGGYQFLTKPAYHPTVARLNGDKYLKKLSAASLETLSIIAYKQPVTKGDIESIRGVNSDYSVQKLLEKDLIVIKGRKEDAPGKPLLYATSRSFMDYFGLNSSEDLPKIKEILQEELTDPTMISDQQQKEEKQEVEEEELPEENSYYAVSENGQLLISGEEKEEPENDNPENQVSDTLAGSAEGLLPEAEVSGDESKATEEGENEDSENVMESDEEEKIELEDEASANLSTFSNEEEAIQETEIAGNESGINEDNFENEVDPEEESEAEPENEASESLEEIQSEEISEEEIDPENEQADKSSQDTDDEDRPDADEDSEENKQD